ncbi:MAG: Efflux transporter, RND family, MFP subunit [Candidatus Falkowbacteria bacterium GW2011_GWA2_41_14]|uniref:Efflux transporter, RND family, MFP subunit n=1 Tax=Candidatus Falkowbacteria bacterium GW2011_GWA2_41_14 TaxID=1618635 RepID=A0A0G0UR19_9BACT|nr:MAG: Efflux transporter, RND family, MFP subunit [Candidatus Falkowbacteria bacterium GW2011_GWA2_41_14]
MFKIVLQHKILAVIAIIVIVTGGYYGYKKIKGETAPTQYVLAKIEKGTLITSVSGSGQVSVSGQVDIKSKTSGDLIYLGIKNGQEVKNGALLAQLDGRDAYKSVRDAEANLESAKLSLTKLKQPADQLSILQAENSLLQAKETKETAQNDLPKAYDDGFNNVADAFLDMPTIMSGLENMLYDEDFEKYKLNIDWYSSQVVSYNYDSQNKIIAYKKNVTDSYASARTKFDQAFENYKAATRSSEPSVIESLIIDTYDTTKMIAEAVKNTNNYLDYMQDVINQYKSAKVILPALVTTHQTSLDSYTGTTNSLLLNLLNIKQTIEDAKKSITVSDRAIAEKTESLANLKAGTDILDLQSQELAIKQKENALLDAKEKLADYYIRAPFTGIITGTNVKKGDSLSSGAVIATLITKQQMAEIPLNEVDAAKIKIGQKATLSFDAIEGLNITGQIGEIDMLGTVSQGVVTYNVKILFDTQDERVKPGMSVSASIVIDIKQNVVMVPNSAIKSSNETYYVEMPNETDPTQPRQQSVEIGLVNDTSTEIISGLKEGDQIITQTITAAAGQTQQKNTGFKIPGIMGGGR